MVWLPRPMILNSTALPTQLTVWRGLLHFFLPRNSRYPDSPPEICYGTDFVTTASAFSSFIWGLNFSTLPWPAGNYFILCRRWQATPFSAVAGRQLSSYSAVAGRQLSPLPSLAGNSLLCRRLQATLFFYTLKTSV